MGADERSWTSWLFGVLAVTVFVVLVAFGLSGSSIGVLYAQEGVTLATTNPKPDDPALLLGAPRPIRTDEWSIATPAAIGQTLQGFPDTPWIGLTRTDAQVFQYSLPTVDASALAKPQTWGYLLLGPERGLSWSWWFPFLLAWSSLYLLTRMLTCRDLLAAAVAFIGAMTPFTAWWTSPSPNLFVGFATLTIFAVARALITQSWKARLSWGALGGWSVAGSVLLLYPPWTVSTGIVAAAFVVGLLVDIRPRLVSVVQTVLSAGAVATAILLPWFLDVRPAFEAINETIYPGQRRSPSGGAVWETLLSAPANLVTATSGVSPALLNQSEVASSWLPLALIAALTPLFLLWGRKRLGTGAQTISVGKGTALALTAVSVLLLAWMLVPGLPPAVGELTLLNRVPGIRATVAVGLALLLLAVVLSRLELPIDRKRQALVVSTASLASAVAVACSNRVLYPDMNDLGLLVTAAGGALITWAFGSIATGIGERTSLTMASVYVVASAAVVNPLYQGLGPLENDPVSQAAREFATSQDERIAVTLGGRELQALVRGGGLQVLSWTTEYPDPAFWTKVLPGQEEVWNNFRNYSWRYDPDADPMTATVTAPDAADLSVDLCDPLIRDLGFSVVFSPEAVEASCLTPDRVIRRGEQLVYIYLVEG